MLRVRADGFVDRHHQHQFEPKPHDYPKPSNV